MPDVVHVEHLRGARYGIALQGWFATRSLPPPVVWDSVDCISSLFGQARVRATSPFVRWWTAMELTRTRPYEAWLVRRFARVLATSAQDGAALEQLAAEWPDGDDAFG